MGEVASSGRGECRRPDAIDLQAQDQPGRCPQRPNDNVRVLQSVRFVMKAGVVYKGGQQ